MALARGTDDEAGRPGTIDPRAPAGHRLKVERGTRPGQPSDRILGLQRLAGNRAVGELIAGRAPITVPRAIGFEFETASLRVRQANEGVDVRSLQQQKQKGESEGDWYERYRENSKRLVKGFPYLSSDDFTVEADDKGDESSVEVVTKAFPENDDGQDRLSNALDDMCAMEATLKMRKGGRLIEAGDLRH
ncbi:MAG: hypothetical protein ACRDZO_14060 [Egibacteraceae bacterium]